MTAEKNRSLENNIAVLDKDYKNGEIDIASGKVQLTVGIGFGTFSEVASLFMPPSYAASTPATIAAAALVAHGVFSENSKTKKAFYIVSGALVGFGEIVYLASTNQIAYAIHSFALGFSSFAAVTGSELISKGKAELSRTYNSLKNAAVNALR